MVLRKKTVAKAIYISGLIRKKQIFIIAIGFIVFQISKHFFHFWGNYNAYVMNASTAFLYFQIVEHRISFR